VLDAEKNIRTYVSPPGRSVLEREFALSEQNERRTPEVSTALLASLHVFVVSGVAAK